ncbi:unnamed protein product [Amoebophrya sp. A25]|nr:unnamed protein product [Amoebophrya sp. A25]|eukprot:GSA25T00003004001.1
MIQQEAREKRKAASAGNLPVGANTTVPSPSSGSGGQSLHLHLIPGGHTSSKSGEEEEGANVEPEQQRRSALSNDTLKNLHAARQLRQGQPSSGSSPGLSSKANAKQEAELVGVAVNGDGKKICSMEPQRLGGSVEELLPLPETDYTTRTLPASSTCGGRAFSFSVSSGGGEGTSVSGAGGATSPRISPQQKRAKEEAQRAQEKQREEAQKRREEAPKIIEILKTCITKTFKEEGRDHRELGDFQIRELNQCTAEQELLPEDGRESFWSGLKASWTELVNKNSKIKSLLYGADSRTLSHRAEFLSRDGTHVKPDYAPRRLIHAAHFIDWLLLEAGKETRAQIDAHVISLAITRTKDRELRAQQDEETRLSALFENLLTRLLKDTAAVGTAPVEESKDKKEDVGQTIRDKETPAGQEQHYSCNKNVVHVELRGPNVWLDDSPSSKAKENQRIISLGVEQTSSGSTSARSPDRMEARFFDDLFTFASQALAKRAREDNATARGLLTGGFSLLHVDPQDHERSGVAFHKSGDEMELLAGAQGGSGRSEAENLALVLRLSEAGEKRHATLERMKNLLKNASPSPASTTPAALQTAPTRSLQLVFDVVSHDHDTEATAAAPQLSMAASILRQYRSSFSGDGKMMERAKTLPGRLKKQTDEPKKDEPATTGSKPPLEISFGNVGGPARGGAANIPYIFEQEGGEAATSSSRRGGETGEVKTASLVEVADYLLAQAGDEETLKNGYILKMRHIAPLHLSMIGGAGAASSASSADAANKGFQPIEVPGIQKGRGRQSQFLQGSNRELTYFEDIDKSRITLVIQRTVTGDAARPCS